MFTKFLFLMSVLMIIWSIIEIVSPKIVFKLYQKIGFLQLPEHNAMKLIRIDGVISWVIFTLITGYLYKKL
ncbi:hypothetical protein BHU72_01200 [Desulfuribacillus stibiiarsenatis]|uniref:Uncharacterized protein n=1 Tax=Desulfuribacillus stibiiarsenatis TaxID=1390249 RepID=A0A1E5L9V5_9FIRM|nr:hypothetical protein [Desulfuribacillus stibiiarsenatis]OEH86907.1 hypothetical protein BHU72_01200 [Desulfuribacillus stibiiarsenatis]